MRYFQAMFALWLCVAMTESVCRGADPECSFITFLSHRSGRNLLYRMRPDGSNLTPIFGGELKDVPGLAEGRVLPIRSRSCWQTALVRSFRERSIVGPRRCRSRSNSTRSIFALRVAEPIKKPLTTRRSMRSRSRSLQGREKDRSLAPSFDRAQPKNTRLETVPPVRSTPTFHHPSVTPDELCGDCPELADELKKQIETLRAMDFLLKPMAAVRRGGSSSASPPTPAP